MDECKPLLLGAALNGWSFVGSDVTDVGLQHAAANAAANPALAQLIDIRDARSGGGGEGGGEGAGGGEGGGGGGGSDEGEGGGSGGGEGGGGGGGEGGGEGGGGSKGGGGGEGGGGGGGSGGPLSAGGVLTPVVRDGERFSFCMCNPPFFETMDEADLNDKTNFGGTAEEMCCEGGEEAFVKGIYADSLVLRDRQGLTLVHFSARQRFVWDMGGISDLGSGEFKPSLRYDYPLNAPNTVARPIRGTG